MSQLPLAQMLRNRHRSLETRIAALEFDWRARRPRVVLLAEELVAHATVEQLVVYPYAEQLLGMNGLALEIEQALDALLGVVGGMDDDSAFRVAIVRLGAVFERHVDGDEMSLLPMIETLGDPSHLARMGSMIEEFERAMSVPRSPGPGFFAETAADVVERGGRN
jgi:hypothetical protein